MANTNFSPSSYAILLSNNGSGLFTPSIQRNPTVSASGGTALTIPWVENLNGTTGISASMVPGIALQAAYRTMADDISLGN